MKLYAARVMTDAVGSCTNLRVLKAAINGKAINEINLYDDVRI